MAGAPHLEKFVKAARHFIGARDKTVKKGKKKTTNVAANDKLKEIYSLTGYGPTAWCALTVSACAKKAKIAGNKNNSKNLMDIKAGVGGLIASIRHHGGTWIPGPYNGGGSPKPIAGDVISFGNSGYHGKSSGYHVGIVEYCAKDRAGTWWVHTIEGNAGSNTNKCKRCKYRTNHSSINGYTRPAWEKLGDDISYYLAGGKVDKSGEVEKDTIVNVLSPLYQDANDRHDMTARQVGYLNSKYNLSDSSSNIAISIINYTSALGELYNNFPPYISGQAKVDTSKLKGNIKTCVDYFIDECGLPASSAAAIAACFKAYSGLKPDYISDGMVDGSYLYGIAAWDIAHLYDLYEFIDDENVWKEDLSGQIAYFAYDLEANFDLIPDLKSQANTSAGAEKSAELIMSEYNEYVDSKTAISNAKKYAKEIFKDIVISKTSIVGNPTSMTNINGKKLTGVKDVVISTSIKQTGIMDDYLNYSYMYSQWSSGSAQQKLAKLWHSQGCPQNRGIATVGTYYCVAVRPKYGSIGDVIVAQLKNGSYISCIICDHIDNNAGSVWGQKKSDGKINIIKWGRIRIINTKVVTSGVKSNECYPINLSGWKGQTVLNIVNYGKYSSDIK
jgi:hypothetical protein